MPLTFHWRRDTYASQSRGLCRERLRGWNAETTVLTCVSDPIAVQAAPMSTALGSICTADALTRWNRSRVSPKDPLELPAENDASRQPVALTWPPSTSHRQVKVRGANDSTALSHFLLDPWIASGISERRGRFGAARQLLGFKAQI